MTNHRLRQIAVLVDSLDPPAADRLLDQLPDELQQRVRDAVMNLTSVSDAERQEVLAEFRRGASGSNRDKSRSSEEPSSRSSSPSTYQPVWRSSVGPRNPTAMTDHGDSRTSGAEPIESPPTYSKPLGSPLGQSRHVETEVAPSSHDYPAPPTRNTDLSDTLAAIDVETLASVVLRESPQVLAAVLSLLPPLRSAKLLEYCSPELQVEALERLQRLEELDDDIVHLLQQELHGVIRQRSKLKQRQRVGSQALAEIMVAARQLENSQVARVLQTQLRGEPGGKASSTAQTPSRDTEVRPELRDPRTHRDSFSRAPVASSNEDRLVSNELEHADALSDIEPRLSFADLVQCDAASLQALLATAKPQVTLLALRGAPQALLDRVLKMLPRGEAKEVQFRVQNLGPTRVQDIQQAQQYLLRLASLLEDMGRFRRPRTRNTMAA
ncbi:MAG: hypothetical protein JNL67_15585 [Planctomycetaceae bacterium]|nr:hypothetical protein [Planctomycetaceae bacterium]